MNLPPISGIMAESLNEWEGRVSAVVFLQGCNLRCPYCHSAQLIPMSGPLTDPQQILKELDLSSDWLDGVVITGGEPTLHPQLSNLIEEVTSLDLQVKVHSNATNPEAIRSLIQGTSIDCLALDFKCPFRGYEELTCRKVGERVEETLSLSKDLDIEREYHTTVCPAYLDLEKLIEMAHFLGDAGTWYLQKYNPEDVFDPSRCGQRTYTYTKLSEMAESLRGIRPNIKVLGRR